MIIDRRAFLKVAGLVPMIGAVPRLAFAADEITAGRPDYTLRIGTGLIELAPDHIVSTRFKTASSQDCCFGSRRGSRSLLRSTMTLIRRSWCTGTAR